MKQDKLVIGGHEFDSRFILGSGKYSVDLIKAAIENAGAQIITLALRRTNTKDAANIMDYIPEGITLLPNTSGARNAEEAVRIARLAREVGCGDFIKIEVIHDSKYLLPDNYETIKATEILAKEGLKISAIQNHYSLLNRSSETSGILDYCRENDILFFSYMVLEQGALTGKYDMDHPFPEDSDRGRTYNPMLPQLEKLNARLEEIADHHNAAAAQIPTAWAIAKGTLPIIGVTKVYQAEDAAKAAEIKLTEEEIASLEQLADQTQLKVIRYWEKEMR